MTDIHRPDPASLALNGPALNGPALNERGAVLIEVLFAVAVFGALVTAATNMLDDQERRNADVTVASQHATLLGVSQNYVRDYRRTLIEDLATAAADTGDAILTVSMQDIADLGLLTDAMLDDDGEARNVFGQSHSLIIRAVNMAASTDDTLTNADLSAAIAGLEALPEIDNADQNGNGIPDAWENGYWNVAEFDGGDLRAGEVSVAAVLVTHDGNPIPDNRGPRIATLVGGDAGFASQFDANATPPQNIARGPYGGWTLPLAPYQVQAEAPVVGSLVSVVALPGIGALSNGGMDSLFSRVPVDRDNDVYVDLSFSPSDMNSAGNYETTPSIRNLADLIFGQGAVDASGDALPPTIQFDDEAGTISNLGTIDCIGYDPLNPPATISDEFRMECASIVAGGDFLAEGALTVAGNALVSGETTLEDLTVAENGLIIDENTGTQYAIDVRTGNLVIRNGNLAVGGTGAFDDDVSSDARVTARDMRIVNASGTAGISLSEAVRDIRIVANGDTIDHPDCSVGSHGGVTLQPTIFVAPAATVDLDGTPLVGLLASASDMGGQWEVNLRNYINEPDPSDSTLSDSYLAEVPRGNGRVLAITRCQAP